MHVVSIEICICLVFLPGLVHLVCFIFQDLLEYMSQLLGEDPLVLEFVTNVGRYQQGESLVWCNTDTPSASVPVPQTSKSTTSTLKVPSTAASKSPKSDLSIGQAQSKRANTLNVSVGGGARARNKSPEAHNTGIKVNSNSGIGKSNKPVPPMASKQRKQQQKQPTTADAVKTYRKPRRGKAEVVCGCFGSTHTALTNCLFCGRISCAREGYDYCPFCGFMVEQVLDDGRYAHVVNLVYNPSSHFPDSSAF